MWLSPFSRRGTRGCVPTTGGGHTPQPPWQLLVQPRIQEQQCGFLSTVELSTSHILSLRYWRGHERLPAQVFQTCPLRRRPQERPRTRWEHDFIWRFYLSPRLGTSQCPPGVDGGSGWGEECLDFPAKAVAPATWISGRKLNDNVRKKMKEYY